MNIDIFNEPIGISKLGKEVFLKDIWPSTSEINEIVDNSISTEMFKKRYKEIYNGDQNWQSIKSIQIRLMLGAHQALI